MLRSNRTAILALAALVGGVTLASSACLVSLDESLIQEDAGVTDAGTDADVSVEEAGDAKEEAEAQAETGVDAEAGTDASDADAAEPDGDATVEPDAPDDVQQDGDVTQPDADAGEGGDPYDGPLVECYDDTWCPPVGCTLRRCNQGSCVTASTMKEDAVTFELPAAMQCNHTTNRTCAVAVRNYLVALTANGFTVFNTRNPRQVREEEVPNNIGPGYASLVRSGERLWAVKNSGATTTELAWLDVPLDGVSPVPPPSRATVYVPPVSARHAAPNDAIYLFHLDGLGNVARYAPGMPTTLLSYATNDAVERTSMAVSGSRMLLHERIVYTDSPLTYRHNFSLQSDLTSPQSINSGTYQEASLTNTSSNNGFFASSRSGAIAWVVARQDSTPEWRDVRAYWVVADATSPIASSSVNLETYNTQPAAIPAGPVAFINNDTIATAVYSGTASPSTMLDIARRQSGMPPTLVKRIPLSPLAPGAWNVAGDAGYGYVITGTTARMFAPSCNP
jgi:hypothetical protein